MTVLHVEALINAQTALIVALDTRDADAIETATRTLAEAVTTMRAQDGWRESSALRDRIGHALKQTNAARIRVNYLSDWTRQRIDKITELRGGALSQTYAKAHKTRENLVRV
jgi:hypothetical protein